MLDAIRFTRGAVAKKDYVPELTHFRIAGGRVTGFNGILALSSPINLDLDVRPKATDFAKALNACEETTTMHLTKAGRLSVRSGNFRCLVDCLPDDYTETPVVPEGYELDLGPKFMDAIRAVAPFMGFDASRPWAMGVTLRGQSAFATNNVCFVEYWHGTQIPFTVNIPKDAINELLRIGQTPQRVVATESSITFFFDGDRWMKTQLRSDPWPEQAFGLFDKFEFEYQDVPDGLFDSIQRLKPFLEKDQHVFFRDDGVATTKSDEVGTHVEVAGLLDGPCFSFQAISLLHVATHVDFSQHPAPCGFLAPGMRGMILGLRI